MEGGSLDIANIMKPVLSGENIRCIGATTTAEFDRFIKQDPAFKRRFQVIIIPEPSEEVSNDICLSWAKRIAKKQGVTITSEAIDEAVRLTHNLIKDRFLPDKAIDLLENSVASILISKSERAFAGQAGKVVSADDIRATFMEMYRIDLNAVKLHDPSNMRSLLQLEVFGQEDAIQQISEQFIVNASSNKEGYLSKPLGVLLFIGPTGVGKTFTAKLIAKALFPEDDNSFICFHMSEYQDKYDLSRLRGSSPGLIGSENQGALFHYAESFPQGIILLDEMEKAHREIQDFFLQIFDEGEARDNNGRIISFSNHFFILTVTLPKGENQTEKLERSFQPEFLSRIDDFIHFKELDPEVYEKIFDIHLELLKKKIVSGENIRFNIDETSKLNIILELASAEDGVRGFVRRFEKQVAIPALSLATLKGASINSISIRWGENKIEIE